MADIDVKICGLTSVEAIDAAARAGASHAGFVFFDPSPRNIRPRDASALIKHVPEAMKRVGVFVDPKDSLLERAIAAARLDIVQLHGEERPERLKSIKARHSIDVWKAIPVSAASDLERARAYREHADLILFDARTPKASRLPGGMGIAFDWKFLRHHNHKIPWGLSGGLNAENVAEAIAITGASMLDVSSGVETEPGIKDSAKISALLEAVKAV